MYIKDSIINKIESFDEIKPFKKNTLSYVGIAFKFDNIIDFDTKQSSFYSAVKSELPYKIEKPASEGSLMLTVSPERNQFGFNQSNESYIEYIYTDNKDNPTLRVIANRKKIDFQCIDPNSNYSTFKDFLERVFKVFTIFTNTYNTDLNLMELVLRKINSIELDENAQYLNQTLLYESNIFNNIANANSYKEFSTVGNSGEIIEFKNGIIKNGSANNKGLIIYDYAIKQDNPNVLKLDKIILQDILKDFSKKIYNLYCYCMSEEYIEKVLNNE